VGAGFGGLLPAPPLPAPEVGSTGTESPVAVGSLVPPWPSTADPIAPSPGGVAAGWSVVVVGEGSVVVGVVVAAAGGSGVVGAGAWACSVAAGFGFGAGWAAFAGAAAAFAGAAVAPPEAWVRW
jgi:hypothetical protein